MSIRIIRKKMTTPNNIPISGDLEKLPKHCTYDGNSNIKKAGVQIEYSEEQIQEIIKCKNDLLYFASNYVYVIHPDRGKVLYDTSDRPYQERMLKHLDENRFSILKLSRQSGKCCFFTSRLKIRNKTTQKIEEITIGEFYLRHKYKHIFPNWLCRIIICINNFIQGGLLKWRHVKYAIKNIRRIKD
jgi:hypothetical protein